MVVRWHFRSSCEGQLVVRKGRDEAILSSQHSSSFLFLKLSNVQQVLDIQQAHTLWRTVFVILQIFVHMMEGAWKNNHLSTFNQLDTPVMSSTYINSLNHYNNLFAQIWGSEKLSEDSNIDLPCNKVTGQVTCTYFRNYLQDWMIKKYFLVLFSNTGPYTLWTSRINLNSCFSPFEEVVLSACNSCPPVNCSLRP